MLTWFRFPFAAASNVLANDTVSNFPWGVHVSVRNVKLGEILGHFKIIICKLINHINVLKKQQLNTKTDHYTYIP